MLRIGISTALCGAILCAGVTRDALAQVTRPATVDDCDFQILMVPGAGDVDATWRAFYPVDQLAVLEPHLRESRWLTALDEVRASFEHAADAHAPNSPDASASLARFRLRQDSVRGRVARLLGVSTAAGYGAPLQELRRVGPAMFRAELRGGKAFLFRGTTDSLVFTDADDLGLRRTICYHAAVQRALLDRFTASSRTAAAAILTAKRTRWELYFSRGYSQLPWELYLNSRNARDASKLDPPTTQWILLHPSVAVQVSGVTFRDLARHDAIALEPIGYIWYRNDYRDYFGLSGAVVFTNGLGTGIGPFIHFGRVAKVGYVFPARGGDDDTARRTQGGVLLSVDLYKYLTDQRAQVDGVMKKLGAKLDKP